GGLFSWHKGATAPLGVPREHVASRAVQDCDPLTALRASTKQRPGGNLKAFQDGFWIEVCS
ncbi:hypothetical protein CEN44_04525, partial [Fischerella muscicola CCMEE 5323]